MKMIAVLILILSIPATSMATIKNAPPSFETEGARGVFVDFIKADYKLNYDAKNKTLIAESLIVFESHEEGMPIFDLVENPTTFLIDGIAVSTKVISSKDEDTWFRIALKNLMPGRHTFRVVSPIKEGVLFLPNGVSSSFWLNDLGDRAFLEAYLPANFEYDQYKITFDIDFKTMSHQKIYTNGIVTKKADNKFIIEFPESYNSSALYYHTTPIGRFKERVFNFRSIDGDEIPAVIYAKNSSIDLEMIEKKVTGIINKLEAIFGPWLHEKVIVHIIGNGGGMEYFGATMTDLGTLEHELIHSYFARGAFMPANGNAGWIDEALTVWIESGMNTKNNLDGVMANMAGQSPYRRYTDYRAYSLGTSFMSYLHFIFEGRGGLTSFLNNLIQNNSSRPMNTESFIEKLGQFYNEDISELFRAHVYKDKKITSTQAKPKKIHMKMTILEMRQFL